MKENIYKKMWNYARKNQFASSIMSALNNFIGGNRRRVKGKNNSIVCKNAFLKRTSIIINGNGNSIELCKNAVLISSRIIILGDHHHLLIGKNCIIKKSTFCFEDNNCEILVGMNTTSEGIQVAALEPSTSIIIGDDCMFSAGISIRNSDSHSIIDIGTNQRINYAKNITIGNHSWIGEDVKILKGSNIGNDCVIGTGSILTGEIPDHSLAAGVPAKILKKGITWSRNRV